MDEIELLQLVRDERARSIGFEHDATLTADRERALSYHSGDMFDLIAPEDTSTATSSDISDAIDTALPDIVEVFTTEEVAAFVPTSEQDVAQCDQETDYVNHVVLADNNGFVLFSDLFRDALQLKVGVAMAQWVEPKEPETERFEGTVQDFIAAMMACRANGSTIKPVEELPAGQVAYEITAPKADGRVKIEIVAPEDFTVAADTVELCDTHYCAYRSRERRGRLVADGFDADQVDGLPGCGSPEQGMVSRARSLSGESDPGTSASTRDHDLVEIVHHFVRTYQDGREVLRKVVTGGDETVLLSDEEIDRIPFAAVTPFRVTHRFYGQSLADKLMEIQRIRTMLLRAILNSAYYAQNQRYVVATNSTNPHTLRDLMDNRPGAPIRANSVEDVRPLPAGVLGFDGFGAMEAVSAMGEQRSGVVRNAQGLNPDSLHETASGAAMLHAAALKRIRYVARMFAETGVKDLYLLVHDLLRTHSSQARLVRMRGQFVQVDPTKWASRDTMTIEIGVGAGGREHDLIMLGQVLNQQEKAIQAGGLQSGLVTPTNVYNALSKYASRAGFRDANAFWSNPANAPPQPALPNPEMAKVEAQAQSEQARLQLEQQRAQADSQHRDADRQSDYALKIKELNMKQAIAVFDAQTKVALAQEELRIKYGAQADQVAQEIGLKGQIAAMQAHLEAARIGVSDQHHVETLQADAMGRVHDQEMKLFGVQHTAGLAHVAAMQPPPVKVTGGDVRPGGEPG